MRWRMQRACVVRNFSGGTGIWRLLVVRLINAGGQLRSLSPLASATAYLSYDPDGLQLAVDSAKVECDELRSGLPKEARISSCWRRQRWGFRRFCCAVEQRGIGHTTISLLYLEPRDYFTPRPTVNVHRREFDLSEEIAGFSAIPG